MDVTTKRARGIRIQWPAHLVFHVSIHFRETFSTLQHTKRTEVGYELGVGTDHVVGTITVSHDVLCTCDVDVRFVIGRIRDKIDATKIGFALTDGGQA